MGCTTKAPGSADVPVGRNKDCADGDVDAPRDCQLSEERGGAKCAEVGEEEKDALEPGKRAQNPKNPY